MICRYVPNITYLTCPPSVMAIEPKAKENFLVASMFLFYIQHNVALIAVAYFLEFNILIIKDPKVNGTVLVPCQKFTLLPFCWYHLQEIKEQLCGSIH